MTCRHCKVRKAVRTKRGLCMRCYGDREVRHQYPRSSGKYTPGLEQTEAELEAMIAEQMATLPAWWEAEARKQAEHDAAPTPCQVAR